MSWIAHRREDGEEQSLLAHLETCGTYAQRAISILPNTAYLAGVLHDMGKYSTEYQKYLLDVTSGVHRKRGSVNHTFAGVRFVLETWHTSEQKPEAQLTAELVAFAIGSHHGLFDCLDSARKNGFEHRLTTQIPYDEAKNRFLNDCKSYRELDVLFEKATQEISLQLKWIQEIAKPEESFFYLTFLGRLLTSAVIQGDRQDTAEFMASRTPKEHALPSWQMHLKFLEENLSKRTYQDTPINQVRQLFSNQAIQNVNISEGIYPLPLPTGGGKTLAGLRYALAYATAHPNVKRIFFVIPLLSILEQNAKEIRDALGETIPVLEHHSNLVQEETADEELDNNELVLESWDAPVIVTTLVQLLNTLFSGKTSCIRRMQALTNSVIVIDEVQSVPKKLLSLFHLAMNSLAYQYGATVILSSATQPCSELTPHPLMVKNTSPIVPYSKELWDLFVRTEIIDACTQFGYQPEEIVTMILENSTRWGSNLTICNTKEEARILYRLVKTQTSSACFFLSADLCPAHREDVIQELKVALLKKTLPVICVSTQLLEAGVDVSFGSVIRIQAGMDSIIQSAGRCNRHGERTEKCPVYIVNWNGEKLGSYLKDISAGQVATGHVLQVFKEHASEYEENLSSDAVIKEYYKQLYGEMKEKSMDYPIKGKPTILEMLSTNQTATKGNFNFYYLHHQAKTAGDYFSVFDNQTVDILVPYQDKGAELIANLSSQQAKSNLDYVKKQLRLAKRYTISIYQYQKAALEDANALVTLPTGNVLALQPAFYSAEIGCFTEKEETFLEFLEA